MRKETSSEDWLKLEAIFGLDAGSWAPLKAAVNRQNTLQYADVSLDLGALKAGLRTDIAAVIEPRSYICIT